VEQRLTQAAASSFCEEGEISMQTIADLRDAILTSVQAERGHFRYESGHHGDLWIELDQLFVDATRMQEWGAQLAALTRHVNAQVVCGPLTGGAFLAQVVAQALSGEFIYSERLLGTDGEVSYRIPAAMRSVANGRRVLLVDDAVNAGSALARSLTDLAACGATVVGMGSLIVLGDAAFHIA
jgi:orotate phosphoribosyltransferase